MRRSIAFAFVGLAGALSSLPAGAVDQVKVDFEDGTIPAKFAKCDRPENSIIVNGDQAHSGTRSLKLAINQTPLFDGAASLFEWGPSPESCVVANQEAEYRNDEAERAELWENKDFAPNFGDDGYYGFSMWIDNASVPYGDFNRAVLGQWKANYDKNSPISYSPFLSQRFTGGFYHITLDVDAKQVPKDDGKPKTCKILLAFMDGQPSPIEPEIPLDRPAICETRLEHGTFNLAPVEKIEIKREAYLPRPFGHWTNLIFRVKGGKNGIVQVWADGTLIVTAKGWIGHKAAQGKLQYFKFGPYRDSAANAFVVYIDDLARGNSKEFVDPQKP